MTTMILFVISIILLILGGISSANKRIVRLFRSPRIRPMYEIEGFIKKLLIGKSIQKIRYSSEKIYGGHISTEFFAYQQRFTESDYIVSEFQARQNDRLNSDSPRNKRRNPLITIPGSPGSGKTTFLAHFAEHQAYHDYVKDADLVLVSTLTFNSEMGDCETAFGLRVIFGMLTSMGLLQKYPSLLRWDTFYDHFIEYKSLTGLDSFKLMNSVFSEVYPDARIKFLLLVDEISKSKDLDDKRDKPKDYDEPKIVMKDIGRILDYFGNVDVIVSSLSPSFIDDLFTPSDRQVNYVIPKPLLGYPIGKYYYNRWVSRLCNLSNRPMNETDETQVRIMKNFYLLYSGHPRSLEYFSILCQNEKIRWENIIDSLQSKADVINTTITSQSYYTFLSDIIETVSSHTKKSVMERYTLEDAAYLSKYVFSTLPVYSDDHVACKLVEKNKLMLYKRNDDDSFGFMAQTISLLKWLDTYGNYLLESYKLQKVVQLAREFENLSISELWEYVIGISIVCNSHDYKRLSSIYGFSTYKGRFRDHPRLNVMYDKDSKVLNSIGLAITEIHVDAREVEHLITPNTLHMAASRQSGFDLRVVMGNVDEHQTNHIYIQCKIGMPMKSLSNTVAGVIYYSVRHFIDVIQGTDLGELHIGLYIWADIDKDTLSTVDKVSILDEIKNGIIISEEVSDAKEHIEILKKDGGSDDSTVNTVKEYERALINKILSYINLHYDHIHILDKKGIEDWLLPSFLSIPYFIQAVNE